MTDYDDRGAYTPPADRLAFDPRQPVRGGGPAPVTLIVSGLVLAALVGGVFFLYRDGFKHRGEAPALVGAPVPEVKTAAAATPISPPAAPPAALVVDKTPAAAPAPAFAPPPATSLPPAAHAAAPTSTALPPAATHAAPQVVMLAPDAAPKPPPARAPVVVAQVAPKPQPKPVVAHVTLAEAAPSAKPAPRRAAPMTIASLSDEASRPRPLTHAAPPAAIVAPHPKPIAALAMAPAPAPKPVATPAPAVAGPSAGWVQIGAFSSADLADQGWRDVARAQPDAMAGKGKAVQPFQRDDKTLYRSYVTGFASLTAAQAFCADLKAAGKACMVR